MSRSLDLVGVALSFVGVGVAILSGNIFAVGVCVGLTVFNCALVADRWGDTR